MPSTTRTRARRHSRNRVCQTVPVCRRDDVRDAVPEQQPEHRERPAVDEGRDRPRHRRGRGPTVLREAAEHRRTLQEVVRVRQRDEQQHEAAREVGPERALPQGGGSDGRGDHGPSPPAGPPRAQRTMVARPLTFVGVGGSRGQLQDMFTWARNTCP